MQKSNIILIGLLTASCATAVPSEISADADEALQRDLAPYGDWSNASYPQVIDGGSTFQVRIRELPKPIAFRFFTFVRLADSDLNATPTACGHALNTGVEHYYDVDRLRATFEEIANNEFRQQDANVTGEGAMLFSVRWTIADIPEEINRDAPTKFCLVRSRIDVGEKHFEGDYTGYGYKLADAKIDLLPRDLSDPLFESEKIYLVRPDDLRQAIELELQGILDQTIPTLNHQIDDVDCLFYKRSKFAPHKDKCKSLIPSQQSSAP